MYCPQCGTLNGDDAISCNNCGITLNALSELKEKPISEKIRVISLVMSLLSLGMGILSFWPYVYLASRLYFPILRQKPFLHSAFDLGCLGGIPLGIAGIVLGILAWRRSQKSIMVITMAVTGTVLGVGGIAGHVWFIATCQFCQ